MIMGIPLKYAVEAFNRGFARSQNSEVKHPGDVLSGTFDITFSLGLSHKDVRGGCLMAAEASVPVPVMATVREIVASAVRELGPSADFTRIHEVAVKGVVPVEEESLDVAGRPDFGGRFEQAHGGAFWSADSS